MMKLQPAIDAEQMCRLNCDLLAVYGTLRRRSIFQKLPVAASRLQYFGCGLIRGRLFWQRTYPALIQGHGIVQVELFRVVDPGVLHELDRYEGFEPTDPRASLFTRRQVFLLNPRIRAWTYFLGPQIPRGTDHGYFRRYRAGRAIGASQVEFGGQGP
jgi:gamma-glutamylcyclotransferase (GGCT)/AIG2-like uncharacterized protein YtfP